MNIKHNEKLNMLSNVSPSYENISEENYAQKDRHSHNEARYLE